MTDTLDLARRAVACKHWRWMQGMLTDSGLRVTRIDSDGYVGGFNDFEDYLWDIRQNAFPNLTDPATIGCLLALVREAWGDDVCIQRGVEGAWFVTRTGLDWIVMADTEAHTLVFALEEAP